nr:MFS transporter [Kribbella sandramycini]
MVIAEATGAFEASMLTVAVPHLVQEFGVSTVDVGWAITGFFLVAGASAAVGGRLGDLFGRRRVLIIVLLLSVVGSLISALIGTFPSIIVGRSIQGVSGAVLPLLMGLVRESVDRKRVPITIAIVAGTVSIASAIGFFTAGILVDTIGWRSIFLVAAGLAVAAAAITALTLPPSPRQFAPGDRIDVIGGLTFVPALAILLYGVSSSAEHGWASPVVWISIYAGIALGTIWAWWELQHPSPLINLRLLTSRKLTLTLAMIACYSLGPFGGFALIQPVLLQYPRSAPVGLGLSATAAGILFLGLAMFGYAASPFAGMLAGRRGARAAAVGGLLPTALLTPLLFLFRDSLGLTILIMLLMSIAATFIFTAIPNLITEVVPIGNASEGVGFYVVVRSIFQSVSTSLVALLLSSSVAPGTQFPTAGAFGFAMALMTAGSLGALAYALLIRSGTRSEQVSG